MIVPSIVTLFGLLIICQHLGTTYSEKHLTRYLPSSSRKEEELTRYEANQLFSKAPFGESLSLFNLFNVFRGSKSKLIDDNGDLKPLDLENEQEDYLDVVHLKATNPIQQGLLKPTAPMSFSELLLDKLDSISEKNKSLVTSPIIFIPGYGGSRLEAKLDKSKAVRYFCDLKSNWHDIWINVKLLLPYMIDCLIDNLRLEFDHNTNTTRNTEGVIIRVKNDSKLANVEYLNNLPIAGFAYFAPIINQIMKTFAYEREVNIFGAPYDFRKAPNELHDYFNQLKETIELSYYTNKNKSITFICHSMGCNNVLYFLYGQNQNWKTIYVRRIIAIAAPWGGSMSALKATALGDNLGMPYLFSESKLIHVQRSLPSTIYLFPNKHAFPDVPLIRANLSTSVKLTLSNEKGASFHRDEATREEVYMAEDFKPFFDKINHQSGYKMWLNTKDLLGSLEAPGVEIWCLVGQGQKTLGRLEYLGDFPNSQSRELYDDGDGTVNLQSAKYCTKWSNQQKQPVYYKEFFAGHMEILKDKTVLNYIQQIIANEEL